MIVRPSGVYGPGDLPDRVVSKFFAKAMKNETITLHNGENKVDFTYRQDAAYGINKSRGIGSCQYKFQHHGRERHKSAYTC